MASGAFGGLCCDYIVQIYKEKRGLVTAESNTTETAASAATQNTADVSADTNTANAANAADTSAPVATAKP